LPYNNLYCSLGSQDSNTDVSQTINETKAAQAKTATYDDYRGAELKAELEFLGFCLSLMATS